MPSDAIRRIFDEAALVQREASERERLATEKQRLIDDFKTIERSSVSAMSDIDLAAWQAKYPKESPHYIFAEQLWKYRLARQSAKFAALIATLAALVGAVVGYVIRGNADGVSKDKTNAEVHQNVAPPIPDRSSNSQKDAANLNPSVSTDTPPIKPAPVRLPSR